MKTTWLGLLFFLALITSSVDAMLTPRQVAECINACAVFAQTADKAISCAKKCEAKAHDNLR